jgi:hypothetical protein
LPALKPSTLRFLESFHISDPVLERRLNRKIKTRYSRGVPRQLYLGGIFSHPLYLPIFLFACASGTVHSLSTQSFSGIAISPTGSRGCYEGLVSCCQYLAERGPLYWSHRSDLLHRNRLSWSFSRVNLWAPIHGMSDTCNYRILLPSYNLQKPGLSLGIPALSILCSNIYTSRP